MPTKKKARWKETLDLQLKICFEKWDLVPNVEHFEVEALRFWDDAPQHNVLQRQRNKKEQRWKETKDYQLKICVKNLDLVPNIQGFEEEAQNNWRRKPGFGTKLRIFWGRRSQQLKAFSEEECLEQAKRCLDNIQQHTTFERRSSENFRIIHLGTNFEGFEEEAHNDWKHFQGKKSWKHFFKKTFWGSSEIFG
jgi:hypothetical protein